MSLRELKREVYELPDINKSCIELKKYWISNIQKNSNNHHPFIKNLSPELKKEVNLQMVEFNRCMQAIKSNIVVKEKLHHYARYLIELKLTTLNGDRLKSKVITDRLLYDEFHGLKNTISEINIFANNVDNLSEYYNNINSLLFKELSLEDTVFFQEAPHKIHLEKLQEVATKQKYLIKQLGSNFVSLTREIQKC
jgi:hypothetical protein